MKEYKRRLKADEVKARHHEIPEEALWSLEEACVRLSHATNAKAFSEDELCPIRAISVSGKVRRIPETLCRQHAQEQTDESRPESLRQV